VHSAGTSINSDIGDLGAARIVPASIPDHVRYHRSDWSGDTLRVTWPSPDKALVMRYVYVHRRLRWIDVFDYAGEDAGNVLDFHPKFYQVLVDGRIDVPDTFRSM
jgi:hypothetical protein